MEQAPARCKDAVRPLLACTAAVVNPVRLSACIQRLPLSHTGGMAALAVFAKSLNDDCPKQDVVAANKAELKGQEHGAIKHLGTRAKFRGAGTGEHALELWRDV